MLFYPWKWFFLGLCFLVPSFLVVQQLFIKKTHSPSSSNGLMMPPTLQCAFEDIYLQCASPKDVAFFVAWTKKNLFLQPGTVKKFWHSVKIVAKTLTQHPTLFSRPQIQIAGRTWKTTTTNSSRYIASNWRSGSLVGNKFSICSNFWQLSCLVHVFP